jgi:uncharacterized SAM-binding protein YcdF (DUF218 family)
MAWGSLKPILSSLLMPLGLLPLLGMLGLLLIPKRPRAGWLFSAAAFVALWLLSCEGTAVWLARTAMPRYLPVTATQLKVAQVQAIVVLGGGTYPQAPEYGGAQPSAETAARLRYGIRLSKQAGLPLAFSGGIGWAAGTQASISEAEVAARVALEDYGLTLRWLESQSRDTAESAQRLAALVKPDGIQRIALVTDALHMPRALSEFKRTGLVIIPAPMGYVLPTQSDLLQWLPSTNGLRESTRVIHELLGLFASKPR